MHSENNSLSLQEWLRSAYPLSPADDALAKAVRAENMRRQAAAMQRRLKPSRTS